MLAEATLVGCGVEAVEGTAAAAACTRTVNGSRVLGFVCIFIISSAPCPTR